MMESRERKIAYKDGLREKRYWHIEMREKRSID